MNEIVVDGLETLQQGQARGHLVGGNLTLVACLANTRWFPALRGAILFLEEVGESAYRVDRLLTQLELYGVIDGVAGIVLGDVGEVGDRYVEGADLGRHVTARLAALCEKRQIPVAVGLPVGHGRSNLTLPFGVMATLSCGPHGAQLTAASAVSRGG